MLFTERLYFADPYLRSFSARVVARAVRHGHLAVALDQSAFYPEGGGQPADSGTLNGIGVVDVQADGDLVWHMLAAGLPDDTVEGVIDWERRFDHMQQHLGQHLLSAGFEHCYGIPTVSFHLGGVASTIDLAIAALDDQQAAMVEDVVNAVIWEDRPVLARFVTAEELSRLALRKPPVVNGAVRVVSVPDFDHSACGGTHPRSTGGVGMVHIRRWERRGATMRVEFVCGGRALRDLRWKNATLGRVAATLSCGAGELDMALARLRAAEETARKGLEDAQERLRGYEARELAAGAARVGGVPVVRRVIEGTVADGRGLAVALADAGCLAVIGVTGAKTQLILAAAATLGIDCAALLRVALAASGGRGGGTATLAQGGVDDAASLAHASDVALAELARRRDENELPAH